MKYEKGISDECFGRKPDLPFIHFYSHYSTYLLSHLLGTFRNDGYRKKDPKHSVNNRDCVVLFYLCIFLYSKDSKYIENTLSVTAQTCYF